MERKNGMVQSEPAAVIPPSLPTVAAGAAWSGFTAACQRALELRGRWMAGREVCYREGKAANIRAFLTLKKNIHSVLVEQ